MGRTLSDFSVDTSYSMSAIAGQAIVEGDLLTLTEAGTVRPSAPALGTVHETNTTAGLSSLASLAVETSTYYVSQDAYAVNTMCELGNGNVVLAYTGNGSSSAQYYLNFRIVSPVGASVVPRTRATAEFSVTRFAVTKLGSDKFVLFWFNSSDTKFTLRIYNNDGTAYTSAIDVETVTSAASVVFIKELANGSFVCVYPSSAQYVKFQIYDGTGSAVGSAVTVDSYTACRITHVLACSGGDFIVGWYRYGADNSYRFDRYDSSGVKQGSTNTLSSTSAYGEYGLGQNICELSNGNIVFACYGNSNSYADLFVYSQAGSLVKSIDLGSDADAPDIGALCPLSGGGFAHIISKSSNNMFTLRVFTSSGVEQYRGDLDSSADWGQSYSPFLGGLGAGGFVFGFFWTNSSSQYGIRIGRADASATALVGTSVQLEALGSTAIYRPDFLLHSSGLLFAVRRRNDIFTLSVYKTMRCGIIGVATESASAGEEVPIDTRGVFSINQQFYSGGVFNNTSETVPGVRGVVVGNSARLFGFE